MLTSYLPRTYLALNSYLPRAYLLLTCGLTCGLTGGLTCGLTCGLTYHLPPTYRWPLPLLPLLSLLLVLPCAHPCLTSSMYGRAIHWRVRRPVHHTQHWSVRGMSIHDMPGSKTYRNHIPLPGMLPGLH